MAEPKENVLMEKVVSLCKRRGFIFPSSEIYGGINGFWDYGPLGAELKRNVKDAWWTTMTRLREDVVGLEATIIMHPRIWQASGHVDTFSDPMCDCLLTKKRFRADQVDPQSGIVFHYAGARHGLHPRLTREVQNLQYQAKSGQNPALAPASEVIDPILKSAETVDNRKSALALAEQLEQTGLPYLQPVAQEIRRSETFKPQVDVPFACLVADPGNVEHARKCARQFYAQRGVLFPVLLEERQETVENSQRYNPENGCLLSDPHPFNLMFKTTVGPIESDDNVAYLRPETAQAIFAQFKNVLETSRQRVPFGIAQIGKAFRNEVTPRNYTFRSREFEQMELEFFIKPDEAIEAIAGSVTPASELAPTPTQPLPQPQPSWGWEAWHKYWVEERIRFYQSIGLPRTTLEEYWQKPEELAHYARATVDLLFQFPFGTQELEGIAARSDFDLSQHERHSGKPMGVFDEELRTAWGKLDDSRKNTLQQRYYNARLQYLLKSGVPEAPAQKEAREDADGLAKGQYIPHVIEPSAGVDRLILALLTHAFTEITETDAKGKSETRVVMKFHPRVAPIKAAVLPLLRNKPDLVAKARQVFDTLKPHLHTFYDDAGSIGRRYARQDEAGTPFCITVDFDTLGENPDLKDTVTVRHRDDGRQERLPLPQLLPWLQARISLA